MGAAWNDNDGIAGDYAGANTIALMTETNGASDRRTRTLILNELFAQTSLITNTDQALSTWHSVYMGVDSLTLDMHIDAADDATGGSISGSAIRTPDQGIDLYRWDSTAVSYFDGKVGLLWIGDNGAASADDRVRSSLITKSFFSRAFNIDIGG
jgi:hypothetical protein